MTQTNDLLAGEFRAALVSENGVVLGKPEWCDYLGCRSAQHAAEVAAVDNLCSEDSVGIVKVLDHLGHLAGEFEVRIKINVTGSAKELPPTVGHS